MAPDEKEELIYTPGEALILSTDKVYTIRLLEVDWEIEEITIGSLYDETEEKVPEVGEYSESSTEEVDWEIEEITIG
jgi:hypothetical protein